MFMATRTDEITTKRDATRADYEQVIMDGSICRPADHTLE